MGSDATEQHHHRGWDRDQIAAPPYVSYNTFRTMLEWLRSEAVPLRFDRSFWQDKFSGSNGTQLVAALRFLGLLRGDEPSPELEPIVNATSDERRALLTGLLAVSYSAVPFDELPRATPAMLRDWFRAYPVDGHTLRKAISFFVNAAKDADVEMSNSVRKMAKTRSPGPASPKASQGSRPTTTSPRAATLRHPDRGLGGPSSGRQQSQTTIELESGGKVIVAVDVDLFRLSDSDREFVLQLVSLTRDYEGLREEPVFDNDESVADGSTPRAEM